jgi:hypothetical protein
MSEFPLKDYNTAAALTITLNSLAIGAVVTSTTTINNTATNRFDEILVEVTIASLAATATAINGALIPSTDGTTFQTITGFPVGSDSVPLAYAYVDSGTSAKRALLRFRQLAPLQYKVMILNGLGVAWAASGNSATWRGSLRETR